MDFKIFYDQVEPAPRAGDAEEQERIRYVGEQINSWLIEKRAKANIEIFSILFTVRRFTEFHSAMGFPYHSRSARKRSRLQSNLSFPNGLEKIDLAQVATGYRRGKRRDKRRFFRIGKKRLWDCNFTSNFQKFRVEARVDYQIITSRRPHKHAKK